MNIIVACWHLNAVRLNSAVTRYGCVCLHYGSAEGYAQALIEETTDIPEALRYYSDYEAIVRDMDMGGEIVVIERDLIVINS